MRYDSKSLPSKGIDTVMRFFLSGLLILLSGCTTTTNYYHPMVQSWRGGQRTALLETWGQPDHTLTTSRGHPLYIYEARENSHFPYRLAHLIGIRDETTPNCSALFEIGHNGRVIDSDMQGTECYASQSFAKIMSNPEGVIA